MGQGRILLSRNLEDLTAWLAQQMANTPITRLLRIGSESVGKIVTREVADRLDDPPLDRLVLIGRDEVSYEASPLPDRHR